MASVVIRNLNDLFGRILKERAARGGRTIEDEGRGILESALSEPTPPERQREAVARRLNRLLQLLNEGHHGWYSFKIPEMAAYLRLDTATDLEDYFSGQIEAPFTLLDQIALAFGVSPDWLKFGHGSGPFKFRVHGRERHQGGLPGLIDELKPQRIYFVRSLNDEGHAMVAFRLAEWKYEGTYDSWHISDHVGATGERQLYELWTALQKVNMNIACGRDLPPHLFTALMCGEVFPGSLLEDMTNGYPRYNSNWFDDFIDIDHKEPIAKDGYAHYGPSFVKAQSRVRGVRNSREKEKSRRAR
jgi:plasmid stability protein